MFNNIVINSLLAPVWIAPIGPVSWFPPVAPRLGGGGWVGWVEGGPTGLATGIRLSYFYFYYLPCHHIILLLDYYIILSVIIISLYYCDIMFLYDILLSFYHRIHILLYYIRMILDPFIFSILLYY